MATLLYLVPSVVLLALTQVQVTSSDLIQVEKNSRNSNGNGNCSCGLSNVTLTMIDNGLQLVDPSAVFASKPSMHNRHMHHLMVNVSRCLGGCGCAPSPTDLSNNPMKSKFVCRPTLTSLKTVMIPVHWLSSHEPVKLTMALEEHKSCLCVDPNSINVTLDVDVRLRRELHMREEEKLSREIRSVAPTISNAIIQTTRATSSAAAHVKSGSSSGSETSATASQAASDMTNGDLAGSVKPTEHEIVYYKTCLACREQQDLCKVNGQIYDSEVCHCVYPASRTFLNSFYTLGVVMLTVMVCCFLVFGVQKGDENVLNSSRRSTRRSNSCSRRCSSTHNQQPHTASSGSQGGGGGGQDRQHRSSVTSGGRRYSSRDDVERNECIGLNNGGRITTNNTNPDQPVTGNNTGAHTTLIHNLNSNNNSNPTAAPSASSATATPSTAGGAHNGSSAQCGPDAIMVNNVASAATTETS